MKIEIEVPNETIADLLRSAFDGGSTYWLKETETIRPKDSPNASRSQAPLLGGMVAVTLKEEYKGGTLYRLDGNACRHGLQIMARVNPRQFGFALSKNCADGDTADIFLQCALFGEVVFA